jgi:hypothetical protein
MLTFLMICCVVFAGLAVFSKIIESLDLEYYVPFDADDVAHYSTVGLIFSVIATFIWACILALIGY